MMKFARYKYAFIVLVALLMFAGITRAQTPTLGKIDLTDVGRVAGATCDVEKAYAFLQSRAVGHGWKITPGQGGSPGLDPEFACRLERLFKAAGCGVIFSAVRDRQDTIRACGTDKGRRGCNAYGRSCHNYGLAVDVGDGSCALKLRRMAPQFKLHFPYSKPHIQCIEHRYPHCSAETISCGGRENSRSVSDIIKKFYEDNPTLKDAVSNIINTSQPSQQQSYTQNFGDTQGSINTNRGISNQLPSQSFGGGQSNNSNRGGQNTIYNSKRQNQYRNLQQQNRVQHSIWDFFKFKKRVASISCASNEINAGERVLIKWSCGGGSDRSRGGTTKIENRFNTRGILVGGGYARPLTNTKYMIQCLSNDKVIGEDVCSIDVKGSVYSTIKDSKPNPIYLKSKQEILSWGSGTTISWYAKGAKSCILRGGSVREVGIKGSVSTGRLFHSTVYALECDLGSITEMKKIEVVVR